MTNIIGQNKLLEKINSYTIDSFPKSFILLGEKGSGRHLLVSYISNLLNLNLVDMSEHVELDFINEIYLNTTPTLYLIDLDSLFEKKQNILLKLLEEPPINAFIAIIAETKLNILNTIINRCVPFELNNYTKKELSSFITEDMPKDLILNNIRTPGKIINLNCLNIEGMVELTQTIIDKISKANYPNTLTLVDKFNYKDEFDKYDVDMFIDFLTKEISNKYIETKDKKIYSVYILTINESKKLKDSRVNKKIFLENYLTKLWRIMRNG